MSHDQALRDHLVYLLSDGGAHLSFDEAFGDVPVELEGSKPEGLPYTPWRLLEHMRIAQWDILEFIRNPDHQSPEWPEGYWPREDAPPSTTAFEDSRNAFRADLQALQQLVSDPATDLYTPLPHGDGQTMLREALLVADHNSYHLGQMVVVRRLLGIDTDSI